ncbi:MAG: hypothetical protein DRJ60_02290 [Thermoprotei archaeon]|nr:MAG: hypothetical protein DRJ60_02290 [Thermoprotei archaeon]
MGNNGEAKKKELKTLMVINIDQDGHTYVTGPLAKKQLCIKHLCAAIEIVTAYQPSPIIKPKGGILNFVRRPRH